MYKLQTINCMSCKEGRLHVVQSPSTNRIPDWLVNTQIELDGTRVYVRKIDPSIDDGHMCHDRIIGLVVSPVY